MTNENLIKLFTSKSAEQGKNYTGTLFFRGGKIYSYNLLIGEYVDRSEEGFIGLLIHDHMATGLGFISMTTSQHVSLLKRITEYHPRMFASSEEGLNNLFNRS
jgi:hypothetical protein|tara:strand:+ start:3960 stop:4268 length:309 start_codon:yes stop_codon:yes gene_type:complete